MTARGDGTARPGGDAVGLVQCVECGRVFNLTNIEDAEEWHYGHDCEVAE